MFVLNYKFIYSVEWEQRNAECFMFETRDV